MTLKLERNDRVRVYVAGGISGGLMGTPVDITLDKISDNQFNRAAQIVRLLTTNENDLTSEEIAERNQQQDFVGDFGHHVEVGNHGDTYDKLLCAFNGHFRRTPLIVSELEEILKQNALPEDLTLKP